MKQSKSSKRWLREHFNDPFVKQSKEAGYRSRAVYKLLEIQEKDKVLAKGMTVVDLGAAPGGWSQVASKYVGPQGKIIALDCLAMEPLRGVTFIQGDFTEESVLAKLLASTGDVPIDLVLSDLAPNMSGLDSVDQPKAMILAGIALETAQKLLKKGGSFVVKIFQGEGFDAYLKQLRYLFKHVAIRKPSASRARSREIYLVAKGYK